MKLIHIKKQANLLRKDRTEYRKKVLDILDDQVYRKLKKDPTTKIEKMVSESLKTVEGNGGTLENLRRHLTPQFSTPLQYGVPKFQ